MPSQARLLVILYVHQLQQSAAHVIITCRQITDNQTVRDIRISNQFLITHALHFAQP